MRKLTLTMIIIFSFFNIYSEETAIKDQITELEAKLNQLKESEAIEKKDLNIKDDNTDDENSPKEGSGEVIYYYLPPEIKVTPEERARVIGKAREKIKKREIDEKVAKGKVTLEQIQEEDEAKKVAKEEAAKAKAEEEMKKKLEKLQKEEKIKAVEKTLGITEKEKKDWVEFNQMSEEMQAIMKKQKELDEKYFKVKK
ncbi:hypothetical protein [Fusobacterium sp. PH5-44]|uniref:hypothetical protein n=1 Tax=unclassified Fusobacterium TaxID=2648384 RepID=UPI003D2225D5